MADAAQTKKSASGSLAKDIEKLSFEDALARLEQIVQKLEAGDVPLEDSIRIYEEGAALKAYCDAKLKDAELKVERIVLGPEGPTGVEPETRN
ncbi:MAG: exodeoxyribonuclease VII small subunit [Pseudomonadota bacterium]